MAHRDPLNIIRRARPRNRTVRRALDAKYGPTHYGHGNYWLTPFHPALTAYLIAHPGAAAR